MVSICILKTPHFTLFKPAGLTVVLKRILVPHDVRVGEPNIGQARQRLQMHNVSCDARPGEPNLGQVPQRLEVDE